QYLGKLFWPHNLAVIYPHPGHWPWPTVLVATLVLAGVTVVALALVNSHRYFAVGWLWFLGTLVPVIGLVQIGVQSMADRYTYIPCVGVLVGVIWGVDRLLTGKVARNIVLCGAAGAVAACVFLTRQQI